MHEHEQIDHVNKRSNIIRLILTFNSTDKGPKDHTQKLTRVCEIDNNFTQSNDYTSQHTIDYT